MKAKTKKVILLGAALVLVAVVVAVLMAPNWRAHNLMRQSEPIQAAVENYRAQHGQYPESLTQIGIVETLEGPIFYQRETETTYILWFSTTLGESITFHSTERKWR